MKRFYLSLIAIAAIAALTAAGSFALFTASTTNAGNTFTAGTVTLGDPVQNFIDINNIAPGDSGANSYDIAYTGNLQAWLGITTTFGGTLTTCSAGADWLTVNGGAFGNNAADQVVGLVNTGDHKTFNIAWTLPIGAGNDCQGKSATFGMTVFAVQAANNSTATGPISWAH